MFAYLRQLTLWFLLALPALATASKTDTVDIYITLDHNGTANISEHWVVDVDDRLSEWYLALNALSGMEVYDFKVYDNNLRTYLTEDSPWDVKRSRDEKAGKSGIVTKGNDSYELCWGVGSSGKHHWTVEYKIKGFVLQYADGCGFYHRFFNDNFSSDPKYIRTTIALASNEPLSAENAQTWTYLHPGTCKFVDGKIVAENTKWRSYKNSMIIMVIFPSDVFSSTNVIANDTIGSMKWSAMNGNGEFQRTANQGNGDTLKNDDDGYKFSWFELVGLVILGIIALIAGFIIIPSLCILLFATIWYIIRDTISLKPLRIYTYKKNLMKGASSKYYREIPLKGDLNRTFYIIDETTYHLWPLSKDNLIAAYIVRLIRLKAISFTSVNEAGKEVFRMQLAPEFDFTGLPNNADTKATESLYNLLKQASAENLVLEKNELKNYLKKNKEQAKTFKKQLGQEDKTGCIPEEFQQVSGLKNFLKDFSLTSEPKTIDVELWDEYLVFATLFGMADKVLMHFKKYGPDYFVKSTIGAQLIDQNGELTGKFNDFTNIPSVIKHIKNA